MSTIAAISTSPGIGGIGIIRISGEDTFDIISKIFKMKKEQPIDSIPGYSFKYGHIIYNDSIIDEVLVSFFKAPNSYTGENICEINSHGGIVIMNRILEACLKSGAILAEPGEFTKRAFINGRLDLSQAEAVIDIINAKTEKEATVSENQLNGNLSNQIKVIRGTLIDLLADIEVGIDYPEYDVEDVSRDKIVTILNKTNIELDKLINSFSNGKILRDGLKVALIGRPNAGKSSLMNLILDEDRAIVTDIEGTTRDSIEEFIKICDIPIKLVDTAGIRNTEDVIEKIGVDKSIKIAQDSDLIIAIFDSNKRLTEEDLKIIELIKTKKSIIVLNKVDLETNIELDIIKDLGIDIVELSAINGTGLDKLYETISQIFNLNDIANNGELIVTNNRHKLLINNAKEELNKALKSINDGMPEEIISTNIREILIQLGKITGEEVTDDVIKQIFSKFCLGK